MEEELEGDDDDDDDDITANDDDDDDDGNTTPDSNGGSKWDKCRELNDNGDSGDDDTTSVGGGGDTSLCKEATLALSLSLSLSWLLLLSLLAPVVLLSLSDWWCRRCPNCCWWCEVEKEGEEDEGRLTVIGVLEAVVTACWCCVVLFLCRENNVSCNFTMVECCCCNWTSFAWITEPSSNNCFSLLIHRIDQ